MMGEKDKEKVSELHGAKTPGMEVEVPLNTIVPCDRVVRR